LNGGWNTVEYSRTGEDMNKPRFCKSCGEELVTVEITDPYWLIYDTRTGKPKKATATYCPNIYKGIWNKIHAVICSGMSVANGHTEYFTNVQHHYGVQP
jgi:hypothetical protein